LAAGKTAFIQGFARGMGYTGRVTSPTFALQNVYEARFPVYHFDWYRLGSAAEVLDLGWEEWLSRGGVVLVEWADKFPELLPPHALSMRSRFWTGRRGGWC
jgi:tRNA threonylcarbamoyladenosine biosynthesis protein TsaE